MRYGIHCKFCGHNLRYFRTVKIAEKTVVCCMWCEMLISYHGPCVSLAQCMDCGIILEGSPFHGRFFTKPDGKPDLSVGHSHGVCLRCAAIRLYNFYENKKIRKTTQEALALLVPQPV